MAYRRYGYQRPAKPQARGIVVKYAGKCVCCGGAILPGESAMYYPVGTIASVTEPKIAHIGGLDGTSAKCTDVIRRARFPEYAAELDARAVNDYAGDGLDQRWEDDGAAICGR